MKRLLYVLVFLALTAELKADNIFAGGEWGTFMGPISTFLLAPSPVKVPLFDMIVIGMLVSAGSKGAKGRAKPIVTALKVSAGSILAMTIWGVVTGGSSQQVLWQVHPFLVMLLLSATTMAVLKTPEDFYGLGKVVVAAAFYRSLMVFIFYWAIVRGRPIIPPPIAMTTHGDTVLFVTAILIMTAWALEARTRKSVWNALGTFAWVAYAIALNNRRLAWVSLGGALVLLYAVYPKNQVKKKLNTFMLVSLPIILVYVAIGWGRKEGIFKPVGSLSSMFGKHEDASSETRNIENYNLLQTAKGNPILGTGWGHEYRELSRAYSIAEIFPQYRYIPHNSVLGLLAFTGLLGFAGTWMVFPVTGYFAARSYKMGRAPIERAGALVALTEIVVYTDQMYGDMGFTSTTGAVIMAGAVAAAGRLAIHTGAWPSAKPMPKVGAVTPDAR